MVQASGVPRNLGGLRKLEITIFILNRKEPVLWQMAEEKA